MKPFKAAKPRSEIAHEAAKPRRMDRFTRAVHELVEATSKGGYRDPANESNTLVGKVADAAKTSLGSNLRITSGVFALWLGTTGLAGYNAYHKYMGEAQRGAEERLSQVRSASLYIDGLDWLCVINSPDRKAGPRLDVQTQPSATCRCWSQ